MKKSKLKKLLHQKEKVKTSENLPANLANDKQLKILFIPVNELKKGNKAVTFSAMRRKIIDEQLNKFLHPSSVHIRLKPYYESGHWLKWIGVLGDVTLANQTNLNGSLLIDKISFITKPEIIDYHAWLNIENIKSMELNTQPMAIGDYLIGYSKVKKYGQGKYGLSTTHLVKAGQFVGASKPDDLVGKYDRQDSWVVELKNNNLTKKNYEECMGKENPTPEDLEAFDQARGHVDVRFQPSRYKKFQERLQNLHLKKSDDVLPLLAKTKKRYVAEVVRSRAVKIPNISHKMPQLEVKNVIEEESGRLVYAYYNLPYIPDLKKLGELNPGEIIKFDGEPLPDNGNLLNRVTNFTINSSEADHDRLPLPINANTFLGYIMWKHPEDDGESSYIANYQTWGLVNSVHEDEIKQELEAIRPTSALSIKELADKLNIEERIVKEAVRQGLIGPIDSSGLTQRYDPKSWDLLRAVIGAQDPYIIDYIKKKAPIYTLDDLIEISGLSRDEIENKIKAEDYFPLNGLHCNTNLYGPKVLNILKAKKSIKDLMPKKQSVIVKREIPRNKSVKIMTEISEKELGKEATESNLKFEEAKTTEKQKISENKEIADNTPIVKSEEKPVETVTSTHQEPETIQTEEKVQKTTENTEEALRITLMNGKDYEYRSSVPYRAILSKIQKMAKNPLTNELLEVVDPETSEVELVSVKAIMLIEKAEK